MWDVVEVFFLEIRFVLFVFFCGSFGVVVFYGKFLNRVRFLLFKFFFDEIVGGVFWKGLVNFILFFRGVCKKLLLRGEDGEWDRFIICGGELNEKFVKLFLVLFFEGVFLLFGVRGVSSVGLFVWLVFKFLLVLDLGVIWGNNNNSKII